MITVPSTTALANYPNNSAVNQTSRAFVACARGWVWARSDYRQHDRRGNLSRARADRRTTSTSVAVSGCVVVGWFIRVARRDFAGRTRHDDSTFGRPVRLLSLCTRRVRRLHRRLERLDLVVWFNGGGGARRRNVLGRAVSGVGW